MFVRNIGSARLSRVEELRIPNHISYFTQDEALIEANRDWLFPHFLDAEGKFDLVFQSFILEVDGRNVLIDPCTGNGRPNPVPFFDHLNVPFIERMGETGYRPEDIDFVVCTHLHHDHCGWNTQLRDGKWVPNFPKAHYVFQQAEYDRWGSGRASHPAMPYNDEVFERSVQPIVEAGLADLVTGTHGLTNGLQVEAAPGHTVGHQMLRLQSDGCNAFFTGDCFHHPIQLADPTIMFGDTELPDEVIAIRKRLVQLSSDLDALLTPAHFPEPYAVKAYRGEAGALRLAAAP